MNKVTLLIPITQKPRGKLGKYGNITHSIGDYRIWQKTFIDYLEGIKLNKTANPLYALAVIGFLRPRKGRPSDTSNFLGAVEDALVKGKFIKDDNYKILPRVYGEIIPVTKAEPERIIMFFMKNKGEFNYFFGNIERLIN